MPGTDLPAQTSECVVRLYTMQLGLIARTSSKEEAERRVIRAMAVVRRLEQAGPRGMRYVVWFEHHFDEWLLEQSKLADSVDSRIATYTHPLRFEIVASDEHEATERRDRLHAWLRTLMQRGLIGLGPDVELEAIEELPSPSFSRPLTIDPSLGPALYPYFAEWSDPAAVPDPDDEAGDQAAKLLRWSSMSLKTDTQSDAVASLRLVADTMGRVGSDIALWKWIVISLHNAVQGFMVLALEGTNWDRVTRPGESGSGLLRDFLHLYQMTKSEVWMGQFTTSRTFVPAGTEGTSIKSLNRFRNEFMHYVPKAWRIYPEVIASFPQMVDDCANVIAFLAFESGNVEWSLQPELRVETVQLITDLRERTAAVSQQYYEAMAPLVGKADARRYLLPRLKKPFKNKPRVNDPTTRGSF
jgi:hypothetical protein